ncbi:MAG: bifunctional aspartate kinase/homoserine dehydrogenase I [Saprospiraceae bacterium]
MQVLKFGGSSVANAERIRLVVEIIKKRVGSGEEITIVCSALGGVTDMLLDMADRAMRRDEQYLALFYQFKERHAQVLRDLLAEPHLSAIGIQLDERHDDLRELLKGIFLLREASPRTVDYVLSFGERNANLIIAAAMRQAGLNAAYVDARQIIRTNQEYGAAKVNFALTDPAIQAWYAERAGQIQVVTGFIGAADDGSATTLGRGGSDYTAAIVAAALNAQQLEIWTDVDGVLSCDPRKVDRAFTLPRLSYAEAMELSHFGAKVIYPPTILPALSKNIPLYIRNTFNPEFEGTLISAESDSDFHSPIKGISALGKVALLTLQGSGIMGVPGTAARLFGSLGRERINVILITQASSEQSISFAIAQSEREKAVKVINAEFAREQELGLIEPVRCDNQRCIVAVVGEQMKHAPGIAGKLFEALGRNGVNVEAIAQGSSELNISFVIEQRDEIKALNAIHDAFFLSDTTRLHVFMMGVGLIGSALLRQIEAHNPVLKAENGLEIVIAGLANSSRMTFNPKGLAVQDYQGLLSRSDQKTDVGAFVQHMLGLNLANTIFVDCTAGDLVQAFYEQILEASISVATPNKTAAASPYARYRMLQSIAKRNNVQWLIETNVGAGLPVLSTLRNLIQSGDQILRIEAVLSGSLSYIFNRFDGSQPFSELVREAHQLGYTEPDPRDDLSGADVRRKVVILAREAGYALDFEDITPTPLLSPDCIDAPNVEAFYEALRRDDDFYRQKVEEAKAREGALRFIACIEEGRGSVGLQMVDARSPFFHLDGSDNMIAFTTARYRERPLVVKGPGAGAEVTAAGLFAELIAAGNFLK